MISKRRRKTKSNKRATRAQLKKRLFAHEASYWDKAKQRTRYMRDNQTVRDDACLHRVNILLELHINTLNSFLKGNGQKSQTKSLALKKASLVQCTRIPRRDTYILLDYDTQEILFTCSSTHAVETAKPFFEAQGKTLLIRRIFNEKSY